MNNWKFNIKFFCFVFRYLCQPDNFIFSRRWLGSRWTSWSCSDRMWRPSARSRGCGRESTSWAVTSVWPPERSRGCGETRRGPGRIRRRGNFHWHKIEVLDSSWSKQNTEQDTMIQCVTEYKTNDVSTPQPTLPVLAGQLGKNWFCAYLKVPETVSPSF